MSNYKPGVVSASNLTLSSDPHDLVYSVDTAYHGMTAITVDTEWDGSSNITLGNVHDPLSGVEDRITAIEKRLMILRPDEKLKGQYELLQDLYDQYKAAEALLYDENND